MSTQRIPRRAAAEIVVINPYRINDSNRTKSLNDAPLVASKQPTKGLKTPPKAQKWPNMCMSTQVPIMNESFVSDTAVLRSPAR